MQRQEGCLTSSRLIELSFWGPGVVGAQSLLPEERIGSSEVHASHNGQCGSSGLFC